MRETSEPNDGGCAGVAAGGAASRDENEAADDAALSAQSVAAARETGALLLVGELILRALS